MDTHHNRQLATAVALVVLLVWAYTTVGQHEARDDLSIVRIVTEEPAMIQWWHDPNYTGDDFGGQPVMRIRVLRRDYETQKEYEEAVEAAREEWKPNALPPSGDD